MIDEALPTRAESLALTRDEVALRTDRWGVQFERVINDSRAEVGFIMPRPTWGHGGGVMVIDVPADAKPDLLAAARRRLAEVVFAVGYPTNGG